MFDFQTAQRPDKQRDGAVNWTALPLSYRYYVSDAVFLAVLEGEPELLAGIDDAVRMYRLFENQGQRDQAGDQLIGTVTAVLVAPASTTKVSNPTQKRSVVMCRERTARR